MRKSRRFEFIDATSKKFWEVSVAAAAVTVQYGRIGTDGQTKVKGYDSPAEAKAAAEKQIAEKVKKGYLEVGARETAQPAATAKPAAKPAAAKKAPAKKVPAKKSASPVRKPMDDVDLILHFLKKRGMAGTFLFTGTLATMTRAEAEQRVKTQGGTVLSTVSERLDYLVAGERPGSKLAQAKTFQTISILTETEFRSMAGDVAPAPAATDSLHEQEPMPDDAPYTIRVDGHASERFFGVVGVELLAAAVGSNEDDFDAALVALNQPWHDLPLFNYLHMHGLHYGHIVVSRGEAEVHRSSIEDILGSEVAKSADALAGNLRLDAGFYYVRINWEGRVLEESTLACEWDGESIDDLYQAPTGELGVLRQLVLEGGGIIDFSESARPGGEESVLVFSRGSEDWKSRHAEVITLQELRERIQAAGISSSDAMSVKSFLKSMS